MNTTIALAALYREAHQNDIKKSIDAVSDEQLLHKIKNGELGSTFGKTEKRDTTGLLNRVREMLMLRKYTEILDEANKWLESLTIDREHLFKGYDDLVDAR